MTDIIVLILVLLVLLVALRGTIKHFKGEGACCGKCGVFSDVHKPSVIKPRKGEKICATRKKLSRR